MPDSVSVGLRDRIIDSLTSMGRILPKGRTTAHRIAWRALGAPRRFLGRVDGQWFQVDPRDTDISTPIYVWQEWEPASSAIWLALLGTGQTVVDVGANKGWFSLLAARRVGPGGRVVSYEPLPRNWQDVEATAAANRHQHWKVRPVAASDHQGTAQLSSPRDAGGTGWGTLETRSQAGMESIEVEVVTLAQDLAAMGIERVDLLKMDIEGHELAAMRGLLPLLVEQKVGSLLVEVHGNSLKEQGMRELFSLMSECGYLGRVLDESVMDESEWRRLMRGEPHAAILERLVHVNAHDDVALGGRSYFKVLWAPR